LDALSAVTHLFPLNNHRSQSHPSIGSIDPIILSSLSCGFGREFQHTEAVNKSVVYQTVKRKAASHNVEKALRPVPCGVSSVMHNALGGSCLCTAPIGACPKTGSRFTTTTFSYTNNSNDDDNVDDISIGARTTKNVP
jgi:hypothetical protein